VEALAMTACYRGSISGYADKHILYISSAPQAERTAAFSLTISRPKKPIAADRID
jgi:hypothetical protein